MKLRTSGAIPPLPNIDSWRLQRPPVIQTFIRKISVYQKFSQVSKIAALENEERRLKCGVVYFYLKKKTF
jgi:hypothetical protein